ncbi:MAG: BrxE family protein [Anaerolineae bacterium]|nr:BrxE family protein [Anaerolineae bacterium]
MPLLSLRVNQLNQSHGVADARDQPPPGNCWTFEDTHLVLSLRLLIARAANRDSLAWWDDESLTLHASFLLERIFPMAPPLAARSLALSAALARHQAACPGQALHLYHLDVDNQDGLALRFAPLLPIPVPVEPITTMDALRQHLLNLIGEPAIYTVVRRTSAHGLQIEIVPTPAGVSPLLHRAQTLAWAYLEGTPGQPVFPFCLE